ncbi:MAG: RNA 2',3'-cyclic phosphodiesterase [Candidatus Binatia bacterium]|nr:RNA 2',3'-cyclic phosphodiesterase [Candidatus Binatia bacterium]
MIRVFVGVRIGPNLAQRISEVSSHLKENLTGIRWVAQGNLHFTLKFLGEVQEQRVAPITAALEQGLRETGSFTIKGRGIGVFPDIREPRVLWVGLLGGGLEPLARKVGRTLQTLGFPKEKRSLKPHLTIGRWRQGRAPTQNLGREIYRWQDYEFGEFRVEGVILFESVLKPTGAEYSPLHVFHLSNEGDSDREK